MLRQARQDRSARAITIFEYLEQQRSVLPQNPSVTALAGALAAFCGVC